MKGIGSVLAVVLALLGGLAHPSGATTLRVPAEHATIQAGIDAATAGDTVLVAPGYYTDQSDRFNGGGFLETACVHLKGGVTLLSEGGPVVTVVELTAPGAGFPKVMDGRVLASPIVIEGFTVVSTVSNITGIDVRDSPGLTLRDCIIRDLGTGPGDGGVALVGTDAEIDGCAFRNLYVDGALVGSRANVVIRNCHFKDIVGTGLGFSALTAVETVSVEVSECEFINVQPPAGHAPSGASFCDNVTVTQCRFEDCVSDLSGSLLITNVDVLTVSDNLFLRNHATLNGRGGAARLHALVAGTVSRNTVVGCTQEFPVLGGAAFDLEGTLDFTHNVVTGCTGAEAVGVLPGNSVTSSCNVFWNNPLGNVSGITLDSTDVDADPRFCDPLTDDYTVGDNSPCLPANSGGCGQIGAFGRGCGVVSVEDQSWGAVKGLYR